MNNRIEANKAETNSGRSILIHNSGLYIDPLTNTDTFGVKIVMWLYLVHQSTLQRSPAVIFVWK